MSILHRPLCPDGAAARLVAAEAPCPERDRRAVLTATILASSMAFVDGTVVHVALPAVQADLGAEFSQLQWIVNGYTLMLGALLLAGGSFGDQVGRRRVFASGIALFALASEACALAPNVSWLIASRVAQGIGAALLVPQSLAIIAASFPRSVRGGAIGIWAAFSALTTSAGPAIGGLLIDAVSWRAVFWINLPLAALALFLNLRRVPESRSAERERIDWLGAALATLGLGAMTYALTRWPNAAGGLPADVLAALVAGIAAAMLFVRVERRVPSPLVPPALFRSRDFTVLNVMTLLLYAALSGALFLLPYNLIQLQDYSAAEAGLALVPLGVVIAVLSRYSGRVADRGGPRPPLIAGAVLVAGGCAALALPGIGGSYLGTFFVPILLISVGMGIAVSPLTTAVMNAVPDQRAGSASGINNAASRIAGLIAVALSGALATAVFSHALQAEMAPLQLPGALERQLLGDAQRLAQLTVPAAIEGGVRVTVELAIDRAFVDAFRAAVLLNASLAGVAAALAVLVGRRKRARI
jgi:EmrB/QacA subfamily drug resistance transporter